MDSKIVPCDRDTLLIIPDSYLHPCVKNLAEQQCIELEEVEACISGKSVSIYIFASNVPNVFEGCQSETALRLNNSFPFAYWKNEDLFMVKPSEFHPKGSNTPEFLPFAAIEVAAISIGVDFCAAFKKENWDTIYPLFNALLLRFRSDAKESFKYAVYPFFQKYTESKTVLERKEIKKTISGEKLVQLRLAKKLNGQTEVETPVGRIDILTDTHVIEVKEASAWKSAIGQVCAYGLHYPDRKKQIHLFSCCKKFVERNQIESFCASFDIDLTYE